MSWALLVEAFLLIIAAIHIVNTGFLIEDLRGELSSTGERLRQLEEDVRRGLPN